MTFCVGTCGVTVGVPFAAVLAALLLLDKSGAATAGLAAAGLHECAHLLVMRAFRCTPSEIRFTPFGIDIVKPCRLDRSYGRDALISLSGPLANLAVGLPALLSGNAGLFYFAAANLILFTMNILPIGPLDGGQALIFLLCRKWSVEKAEKFVSVLSFFALTPLAVFGFFVLFRSRYNFSLLLVCVYLMALLVMKKDSQL